MKPPALRKRTVSAVDTQTQITMESEEGFVYTINGVRVVFPCKAYPTQLCMMDKIIKGIERQQNCLLESPTGSGKSLALLCSSLAWQAAEYDKKEKMDKKIIEEALDDECCPTPCETGEKNPLSTGPIIVQPLPVVIEMDQNNPVETTNLDDSKAADTFHIPIQSSVMPSPSPTDDDFQPLKKRFRTPGNQQSVKRRRLQAPQELSIEDEKDHEPPEWTVELTADGYGTKDSVSRGALDGSETKEKCSETKEKCSPNDEFKGKGNLEKIKVPKIFFGTRTHKQIAQITRELGKTLYKTARMSILSSREHSCVHPVVSNNTNKNEACKKLLDGLEGVTCKYYQKVHTMKTQASIRFHGLDAAWDIEDLVTLGNRIKACPYYAARELMKEADIIFCPYNYLIDPKIRRQMDIDLKDQILVLDEAHNVEDSARDAASFTINAVELQDVLDDLDKMVSFGVLPEHHRSLHILVANLLRWIHFSSTQLIERGFEQSSKVWAAMEIVTALEEQGITPATFLIHWEHFEFILASLKDPNRHSPSLSSQSLSRLEGIFLVAQFMLGNEMKYISDYRVAILKTAVMVRNETLGGGWRRSHGGTRKEWTHSLNFWCLNPAVVFSQLGSVTRCIILTSGTLSPIASFSSELGINFPIQLEANHVIANSQVWVGTLSTGPNGSAINASYHSAETFMFQDEVGRMVLRVCETVPHGVLCFFPSYNMLDKLSKRWQTTGLWSQLLDKKDIVSEPRSGDKSDFDDIMHQFYHAVRVSEDEEHDEEDSEDGSSVDGGLFLAVCRGKVSEGLDFADNNARAVITIGIPFPNVKDVQVELKRKYNNFYASRRGLLTGSEWYEIQAYRALNQALGRCIRHKKDWGAILLIDERFNKSPKYTNGISKWVRHRIMRFHDFHAAMSSLKDFASARKMEPCPPIATTPHPLSQQNKSTLATPTSKLGTTLCSVDNQHTDIKPSMESTPLHTPQGNRVVRVSQAPSAGSLTVLDACDITPRTFCFQKNGESTDDGFKAKSADPNPNETKSLHSEAKGWATKDAVKSSEFCDTKACVRETPSDVSKTELSSSPLLFSTPCSSPSSSPVTESKETAHDRKGTEICSITDNHREQNKCIDRLTGFIYHKRIDSKEREIVKDEDVNKEPIRAFDKSNYLSKHSAVKDAASTVRKLFKNRAASVSDTNQEDHGSETNKPRDITPDPAIESANCAQTATLENVFPERKSGENKQSKLAPKSEPALRSNLRRSQRKKTRRSSTVQDTYALQKKVDQEDRDHSLFCCSQCTTDLLSGHVTRESIPRALLDSLSGSTMATLNGGSVFRADEKASQTLDLCPLVDIKSEQSSSGFKFNSVYIPAIECCCIPQVCRVCSANGESKVVGVEVISFKATSDQELSQRLPAKQVWLFENLVTCSTQLKGKQPKAQQGGS